MELKQLVFLAVMALCSGTDGCGPGGESTIMATQAPGITVEWEASPSASVLGYRLYWGTSSGRYPFSLDVGPKTRYTVTNLQKGTIYFFSVTAYDALGEGPFSEEVVSFVD